jgi:hypothetical protein
MKSNTAVGACSFLAGGFVSSSRRLTSGLGSDFFLGASSSELLESEDSFLAAGCFFFSYWEEVAYLFTVAAGAPHLGADV